MKPSWTTTWALVLLVTAASLELSGNRAAAQGALTLSSPAFASGEKIPTAYTCWGQDKSPALVWKNLPKATRSVALVVSDPDAPMGTFVHWVIYDISATQNGLPESISKAGRVTGIGTQGVNSTGQLGYKGPCPPSGAPHHYHFVLRALDFVTQAKPGLSASTLERLIQGHVLASTEIVGIYQR